MSLNELLEHLIEALREELRQHGEFLARIDDLQGSAPQEAAGRVRAVIEQHRALGDCRHKREQIQHQVARLLGLSEPASAAGLARHLPAGRNLLVGALLEENSDLSRRVESLRLHLQAGSY